MKNNIVAVLLLISGITHAQTWSEWVQQNKTERKYLLQQIAALNVYIGYVRTGYTVAKEGLNTIGKIKRGDFGQHQNHFTSLSAVNPKISSSKVIEAIITMARQIASRAGAVRNEVEASDLLTSEEKQSLNETFQSLVSASLQTVEELSQIVTPASATLSDDERIKRVKGMYGTMHDQYSFFVDEVSRLRIHLLQRASEKTESDYSRVINKRK